MPEITHDAPETGHVVADVLLTHGASQPVTSRFFSVLVPAMLANGLSVWRFEFDYMRTIKETGKRRPPPRIETLFPAFLEAVDEVNNRRPTERKLVIGGKSMGGRIASMLSDELFASGRIGGLVCLGYPFHPPKKPESLRTAHLAGLRTPALFAQGDRDPFGTRDDVAGYSLSPQIEMHWVPDGDHDFGPRGKSGFTRRGNIEATARAIASFAARL